MDAIGALAIDEGVVSEVGAQLLEQSSRPSIPTAWALCRQKLAFRMKAVLMCFDGTLLTVPRNESIEQ